MATIDVKDAAGATVAIEKPLAPGRAAAAASRPVVLSNEDLAAIASQTTSAAILAKLSADPATQTTLAALLAKVIAAPATEAKQDTAATLFGGVTEGAPGTDTASSGLNGRLQRIAQNLTTFFGVKVTAITALATGGSGVIGWLSQIWNELATNGIKQATQAYDVAVTITRPANQTPYTGASAGVLGDSVGGALTFASMGPSGAAIMLTSAQLELDIAAVPTGMTSFGLHLYNVTPPSATADNGAVDLPSGDRASYLGYISFGVVVDFGSTLYVEASNINKQIKLSGTSLFAYLVTNGGFTPAANSEVYKVTLHAVAV